MNIQKKLNDIASQGLKRELLYLDQAGSRFTMRSKVYINFSSNDYLNLATSGLVKKAAKSAISKWGVGATGSRLMSGSLAGHKKLEDGLAKWCGYEGALIFGSGFLANVGVVSALADRADMVFFDKLDHASLIDGVMLSGAKWQRYKHKDVKDLQRLLEKHKSSQGHKFIITDSVFSMDGDVAPLKEIVALSKQYNAFLIVDEAHALGVFGKKGAGVAEKVNVKPDIITGTMSKSLGSYGGFVACSNTIKEWLINKGRTFVYSTALPVACTESALSSIRYIEKKSTLGSVLLEKAKFFYGKLKALGFELLPLESQIIPVMVRNNNKAVTLSKELLREGVFVKAIRPPTVPKGSARIRMSITLGHTKEDIKKTLTIMEKTGKKMGLI